MPKKLGKWGTGPQEYVPAGNGDASGEYADDNGNNIHYFAHFAKQPTMEMTGTENTAELKDKINNIDLSDNDLLDPEEIEESEIKDGPEIEFVKPIKKSYETKIKKWNDTDCYDYLLSFEGEFDENKLKNLDSDTLHELALAKMNVETKNKDYNKEFIKKLKEINEEHNIWLNVPQTYDDFIKSKNEKEKYFESFINSANAENYKNKLDVLKNIDVNEWQQAQEKQQNLNSLKKESEKLLSNYYNPDNVYSQKAKDNAIWYKSNAKNKASKYFETAQQDAWDSLNENEAKTIYGYTKSYSSINEPLRKIKYGNYGSYSEEFIDKVKNMTSAIDKCVLKDNMWVQRGVNKLNVNGTNIGYDSDISNLEGVVFEDQGFVSCGAGKGTGFPGNIIMNIYCPKGTKGIYVGSDNYQNKYVGNLSHFAGTNENELILQRGYSYKITKTEKKNGQIYLDCEVILNSDVKKYDKKQLEEIKEKYFV